MNSPPMATRAASLPTLMCALRPPAGVPRASLYQAPDPRTTKRGGKRARGRGILPSGRVLIRPGRAGPLRLLGAGPVGPYQQAGVTVPVPVRGRREWAPRSHSETVSLVTSSYSPVAGTSGSAQAMATSSTPPTTASPSRSPRCGPWISPPRDASEAPPVGRRTVRGRVRSPPQAGPLVPVRRPTGGGGSGVDQGGEDDGVGFVVLGFFVEGSPAGDEAEAGVVDGAVHGFGGEQVL